MTDSRFYIPIRSERDLGEMPLEGRRETLHLDFKRAVGGDGFKARVDLANDIAAFANAWGGTLLVGVAEKTDGGITVAGELFGVEFEKARQLVEQTVNHYVHPPPHFTCDLIRIDGKALLAVNIDADDRLIAVWDGDKTILYPVRQNHGNRYMNPSEIAERSQAARRAGEIAFRRAVAQTGEEFPNVEISSGVYKAGTAHRREPAQLWARLAGIGQHDFELILSFTVQGLESGHRITLPFGLIRDAWYMNTKRVGLVLGMALVAMGGGKWMLEP